MSVSKHLLAEKLSSYLNHDITKEELISWSEHQMQETTFESDDVQSIVARLGVMDAKNFEVSYEELSEMLARLGYKLKVEVV